MFKVLKAENFLSFEKLEYTLQEGITSIEGFNLDDNNSEGSGKSAILNAICWVLYAKIPKDAAVDEVIKEGKKSCRVEILLDNGIEIIRSRKPNDLYMLKDKVEFRGKDMKETQEKIEEMLGLSLTTFLQSIYFAQNYPKKFVTSNEVEKAKILSEIQDLTVFDKARKKAQLLLKSENLNALLARKDIERDEEMLNHLKEQIDCYAESQKLFESDKKDKISELKDEINECREELEESEELLKSVKKIKFNEKAIKIEDCMEAIIVQETKLSEAIDNKDKIKGQELDLKSYIKRWLAKVDKASDKIESLKNPKNKECPMCKTVLEKLDKNHFAEEIAILNEEIEELLDQSDKYKEELEELVVPNVEEMEEQLKELDLDRKALHQEDRKLRKQKEDYTNSKRDITRLQKELSELETEILDTKKSEFKSPIDIVELSNRFKLRQKSAKKNKTTESKAEIKSEQLETLKHGFKEVKQFVFRSILNELTRKSNRYLADLFEQAVTIQFTNESEGGDISKILVNVTIDGIDRPLGLYSGGQFRRIQLAVDLALSDIVSSRGTKSVNLIILDEYFKDLSEPSMEKAIGLLSSLGKNVIMIEHNSIIKQLATNVFKVELQDGTSREVN